MNTATLLLNHRQIARVEDAIRSAVAARILKDGSSEPLLCDPLHALATIAETALRQVVPCVGSDAAPSLADLPRIIAARLVSHAAATAYDAYWGERFARAMDQLRADSREVGLLMSEIAGKERP